MTPSPQLGLVAARGEGEATPNRTHPRRYLRLRGWDAGELHTDAGLGPGPGCLGGGTPQ